MSEKEYDKLYERLIYNLSTRTNLLTFSFTTVSAVLGLAIGLDNESVSPYLFLVPFFLIVPFTARIVYYRIVYAHICSFMITHFPDQMQYNIKAKRVDENQKRFHGVIAWLNNFEMTILAAGCAFIFYIKYCKTIEDFSLGVLLSFLVPLILIALVFAITMFGYKYMDHQNKYEARWLKLLKAEKENRT